MKILRNFPKKHPFWCPYFKYICRPSRCAKNHSPQGVQVHFRRTKESVPEKFQAYERCVHIQLHASYGESWIIYTLFLDQRYMCCSMKHGRYIKPLSDQRCREKTHEIHCFCFCFHLHFSLSYQKFVFEPSLMLVLGWSSLLEDFIQ